MIDYSAYLKSEQWKEVRELALKRAGYKCQLCSTRKNLEVHHNSYTNLGNESDHLEDLVVLCADHHQLYHRVSSDKKILFV